MLYDARIISGITVFVAVAKSGSYARAADHVGLSRSGVAKAIARLEERTGMRLFDRNVRALKLTGEGRAFLEEVMPMLERLGEIASPSGGGQVRGRLRVSTDAAFGPYLLVPAMPQLLAIHPQLRISLLVRDRVDNLLVEGVDVAVRFGAPDSKGLDKRLILQSRVVTCATPAYIEKHGLPANPEDIASGHNCIRMLDDVTGKPHVWNFQTGDGRHSTIAVDCGLVVNDAPSLVAAALSDYGIVRLLDFIADEHLASGRLVEILPEWNSLLWPAYLYAAPDAHRSQALRAFMDFIESMRFADVRGTQADPAG